MGVRATRKLGDHSCQAGCPGCSYDSGSMLVHCGCSDGLACLVPGAKAGINVRDNCYRLGARCRIRCLLILTATCCQHECDTDTHNSTAVVGIAAIAVGTWESHKDGADGCRSRFFRQIFASYHDSGITCSLCRKFRTKLAVMRGGPGRRQDASPRSLLDCLVMSSGEEEGQRSVLWIIPCKPPSRRSGAQGSWLIV